LEGRLKRFVGLVELGLQVAVGWGREGRQSDDATEHAESPGECHRCVHGGASRNQGTTFPRSRTGRGQSPKGDSPQRTTPLAGRRRLVRVADGDQRRRRRKPRTPKLTTASAPGPGTLNTLNTLVIENWSFCVSEKLILIPMLVLAAGPASGMGRPKLPLA